MGVHADHHVGSVKLRAFTLAEAMISMAMISLILGLAASIFVGYTRIRRQATPHERNLTLGYSALERMRGEFGAAAEVFRPDPSSTALFSTLTLNKLEPTNLTRLPDPPDPGAVFEPADPGHYCQVQYSVVGGQLLRNCWAGAFSSQEIVIPENVQGLTTQFISPGGVHIQLNLREETANRVLDAYGTLFNHQ